jgi:hypothetical protein
LFSADVFRFGKCVKEKDMRRFTLFAGCALAYAAMLAVPAATPAIAQGVSIRIGSPHFGPPPPRVERRTNRPFAGAIWINGNWRWNGSRYTWVSGRWDRPRAGYRNWQDGHWVQRGRNWVWIDGRWR